MAKFIVYYQTVATIPVEVDIEVDHLGGRHFEEAIRTAAEKEFQTMSNHPSTFTVGKFQQSWDDDSIVRLRP